MPNIIQRHILRLVLIALMLAGSIVEVRAARANPALRDVLQDVSMQHKWVQKKCTRTACNFASTYPSPFPWSQFYPVEAMLDVEVSRRGGYAGKRLEDVLQSEIYHIRKDGGVTEYMEEDNRPVAQNIASWLENDIGFIKYRYQPKTGLPFTVIHGIYKKADRIYYVHLLTFFAKHQDEIRADHRAALQAIAGIERHNE